MAIIIPYEEKLYTNEGAFIDPNGNILFTYGRHLGFATNYCLGRKYDYLLRLRYGNTYDPNAFEDYKREQNYQGRQEDIDIYSSSQLKNEQLELLKLYLDDFYFARQYDFSDFLVFLLHFDKVETVIRRCITTTDSQPHIRFYNYYLMDWRIDHQAPMKFNSETSTFEYDEKDDWVVSQDDKEAEEEIKEIKSRVLIKDRPLFFK